MELYSINITQGIHVVRPVACVVKLFTRVNYCHSINTIFWGKYLESRVNTFILGSITYYGILYILLVILKSE